MWRNGYMIVTNDIIVNSTYPIKNAREANRKFMEETRYRFNP